MLPMTVFILLLPQAAFGSFITSDVTEKETTVEYKEGVQLGTTLSSRTGSRDMVDETSTVKPETGNQSFLHKTTKPPSNIESDLPELAEGTATSETEVLSGAEEDDPTWRTVLDKFQLSLTVLGFAANVVTLITLMKSGGPFNSLILLLLKHQSGVDAAVCGMAATLLLQPSFWTTGVTWLDAFICHVWHSQTVYWYAIRLSIWNLVFISAERYMAVCKPFAHSNFSLKRLKVILLVLHPVSALVLSLGLVQIKFDFETEECVQEHFISGQLGKDIFLGFAIFAFTADYLCPVAAYVFMYSQIILTLRRRQKDSRLAASRLVQTAFDSMLKTGIALTLIFVVSIGFDLWYFLLGYTGVVSYVPGTPVQKAAVFLAVFNSCANPGVYVVLMPAYRKSLKSTFCCDRKDRLQTSTGNSSSAVTTTLD